jgi:hypothetical protein
MKTCGKSMRGNLMVKQDSLMEKQLSETKLPFPHGLGLAILSSGNILNS